MALIPLLRVIVFSSTALLSLGVLGICAHVLWLTQGYTNSYLAFAPFGTATAAVTAVSLPLFLILGRSKSRIFTSVVLFEIIWFFILWILWVATAGTTVAARAWFFPYGCFSGDSICYEITAMEAFAFLNFFAVFIYYDVLFLYAIICAIRGRSIWTLSVREAASSGVITPAVPMNQAQYPQQFAPQYAQYPGAPAPAPSPGAYPSAAPQPYYPQQAPLPGQPYPQQPYPPSAGSSPAPQQPTYGAYPGSFTPQGQPQTLPAEYQPQPHYGTHQA